MGRNQRITLRRLRLDPQVREMVREVRWSPDQLVQPYFVVEGIKTREAVPGLKGTFRDTPQTLLKQVEADLKANGSMRMLLFGVPGQKRQTGFSGKFTADQIRALKRAFGQELWIGVDVCLCSSTDHGQCGVLNPEGDHVENGETVQALASLAAEYAVAGADCVAPSDMMDGRVRAIRDALEREGCEKTLLMSYSAKFNSKFYGPFRAAADSAPKGSSKLRNRATYQIDPARPSDAYLSSKRDVLEGADILMVKPGLPYLDQLRILSKKLPLPWAVYQVSGEYAGIEMLAEQGLIDRALAHAEAWTAFVRAGASMIITYGARYGRDFEEAVKNDRKI
jgi:porphobilinogen synthase